MGSRAGKRVKRQWPCVGNPDTWQEKIDSRIGETCELDGVLSVTGMLPGGRVAGCDTGGPVYVVLSTCKFHASGVRAWMCKASPEEVDVWGTADLTAHWDIVAENMEGIPVLRSMLA